MNVYKNKNNTNIFYIKIIRKVFLNSKIKLMYKAVKSLQKKTVTKIRIRKVFLLPSYLNKIINLNLTKVNQM